MDNSFQHTYKFSTLMKIRLVEELGLWNAFPVLIQPAQALVPRLFEILCPTPTNRPIGYALKT